MNNQKTLIIAEAGINHNGKIANALKLVKIAKNCDADYVKFQIFDTDLLLNKNFSDKKINLKKSYKRFKKLEFSLNEWRKIVSYAKKIKIKIFFSIFDLNSLKLLRKLRINLIKVPSGEITNIQLLKAINSFKIKTILSTGMSSLSEINTAIKALKNCEIDILHCVSEYPTKFPNLAKINFLKKKFKKKVGFSDHTNSTIIPSIAAANGAHIIEKHFTYNKSQKIGDHKMSLSPGELSEMIKNVRVADQCKDKIKLLPTKEEIMLKKVARKSIFYSKDLKIGDLVKESSICFLRPLYNNLPAENYKFILNKRLKKNVKALTAVKKEHLNL